jgi:hypothetical protein
MKMVKPFIAGLNDAGIGMRHDFKERIEKLMDEIECEKDFICYRSEFENLCHVKDIGIKMFVECLEKIPQNCTFSFPFAATHLCKCPVRVLIAKELNK